MYYVLEDEKILKHSLLLYLCILHLEQVGNWHNPSLIFSLNFKQKHIVIFFLLCCLA